MDGLSLRQEFSDRLRDSSAFRRLSQDLGSVSRLSLPAAVWVLGLLAQDRKRRLGVVVPHEADLNVWRQASGFFGLPSLEFPSRSLTPYQPAEPSLATRCQEAVCLWGLTAEGQESWVCTPSSLFRRLPEPETFRQTVRRITAGTETSLEGLAAHLIDSGYRRVDLVTDVGEIAVRGGILDLFSPGSLLPVRLDLFGDTVESVREFDPTSQRTRRVVDEAVVLPLELWGVGQNAGACGPPAPTVDLGGFAGDTLWAVFDPDAVRSEVLRYDERRRRDREAYSQHGIPPVDPERLEQSLATVEAMLDRAEVRIGELFATDRQVVADFEALATDSFRGQLQRFWREVEMAHSRGERCFLVAPAERHPRLAEFCQQRDVNLDGGKVALVDGSLDQGFRLAACGLALWGEAQLFAPVAGRRTRRRSGWGSFFSGLRDLQVGDYVVHVEHGIGQFLGLRSVAESVDQEARLPKVLRPEVPKLPPGGVEGVEVMELAYASGRRLLLPLAGLDLIQRFSGIEGVEPRLDQLGGSSWNRARQRVLKGVRELAGDLLKLYAQRELATAPPMESFSDLQEQFAAQFEYRETDDQRDAIAAILEDLGRDRPMDRLLCGDVGFGKTEVAMRAAFSVVDSGYQVAVLAPTTILADQHFDTFCRRLAEFPVTVELVSRRRGAAELKDVCKRLAEGKIDILVGTHRLLSRDVQFAKLGLVVVDEEQRFGVGQKERLKERQKGVHVLSLSATPVPRTLQLSLAGVRDMSTIESPPKNRMAVETAVVALGDELIREAIEFEMERGGQVYYVFNRVQGIDRVAARLGELVPGIRVTVGHGQLDEMELSNRMRAFKQGEYDLLVATTIIENGIDIPNVNTMLIHHADRFGMAQLYQLRGRVGRSDQLAYCYLMTPGDRLLSQDARRRLRALDEFCELGAGFRVAAHDLEIRGAGNLLGAEQSGHIAAVGVETYMKMLETAVRELRGETVEEAPSTTFHLPVDMAIPEEYVADVNLRMEIYRRAAAGEEPAEALLTELADRFGEPPKAVRRLLQAATLKRRAEALRVQAISFKGATLLLQMRQDARINVDRLIRFVGEDSRASFSPSGVLSIGGVQPDAVLSVASDTLAALAVEIA